jgi:hypothetical protein
MAGPTGWRMLLIVSGNEPRRSPKCRVDWYEVRNPPREWFWHLKTTASSFSVMCISVYAVRNQHTPISGKLTSSDPCGEPSLYIPPRLFSSSLRFKVYWADYFSRGRPKEHCHLSTLHNFLWKKKRQTPLYLSTSTANAMDRVDEALFGGATATGHAPWRRTMQELVS